MSACPNCAREYERLGCADHANSGCVYGVLLNVIEERESVEIDEAKAQGYSADRLWRELGSVLDNLESEVAAEDGEPD